MVGRVWPRHGHRGRPLNSVVRPHDTHHSRMHPHPRAVVLARVFLCLVGTLFVAAGVAMSLEALASPAWWTPLAAVLIGGALLLSAAVEGSRGVVATFLIFFFPWT
jgi:hypothetical protein